MSGKMTEQHMVGSWNKGRKIGTTCVSERKTEKGRKIGYANANVSVSAKGNENENENENEKDNAKENVKGNAKESVKGNEKRSVKENGSGGRRREIESTNVELI